MRRGAPQVMASVSWERGEPHRDRGLFAAILARRSNPRRFDGRAVTLQQRAQLLAMVPEEFNLRWLDDPTQVRAVAALAGDAIEASSENARAQAERYRWVRFSDGDERRAGDGVTPEHMSLMGPRGWLAARALHPRSRAHAWGAGSLAHEASSAIRSAGSLALLTSPRPSEAMHLLAGQVYERIALQATALGLAQQPLASPLESPQHRTGIAERFGAAHGEEPLLLVRIGHARAVATTVRRAVALVSTWHIA